MTEATSFRAVIDLWPSRKALAADLCGADASEEAVFDMAAIVSKWWQRMSIPADWWAAVLATDVAKANGVTADDLAGFAARPAVPAVAAEARP